MKPRLLDLFCGAGGAGMGYHRAGFEVVGVDIKRRTDYPFEFHQADALTFPLDGFDVIHASPPCQAFTRARHAGCASKRQPPNLVPETRTRLVAAGVPWVIENVEGAPVEGVMLCGSMFGLGVRRHRLFESSHWIGGAGPCRHREQGRPVGVYGRMGDHVQGTDSVSGKYIYGGRTASTLEEGATAMGIDWMPRWDELKEAIPPAYTEHLGRQLLSLVTARVA
jgi:DNA (cytosine-5)-methyltransferase 1